MCPSVLEVLPEFLNSGVERDDTKFVLLQFYKTRCSNPRIDLVLYPLCPGYKGDAIIMKLSVPTFLKRRFCNFNVTYDFKKVVDAYERMRLKNRWHFEKNRAIARDCKNPIKAFHKLNQQNKKNDDGDDDDGDDDDADDEDDDHGGGAGGCVVGVTNRVSLFPTHNKTNLQLFFFAESVWSSEMPESCCQRCR